jgi:hypothetical protein
MIDMTLQQVQALEVELVSMRSLGIVAFASFVLPPSLHLHSGFPVLEPFSVDVTYASLPLSVAS